jgi:micrococcal nuclease
MYKYNAKLVKVVDGDTVDLNVDLGFDVWIKQRFRLEGIDAPEMQTPTLVEGRASKAYLTTLLTEAGLSGLIMVDSHGKDKYGRWVARLSYYEPGDTGPKVVDASDRMILDGFAKPYP